MNLKVLHDRQTVYHISRFYGRFLSPSQYYARRDLSIATACAFGPISPSSYERSAQQKPKFSGHNCFSNRYFYSSEHASLTDFRLVPKSNCSDYEEEDNTTNEFLSRFVLLMRGKLTKVYTNFDKQTIDRMLLTIVAKVASEIEEGNMEQMFSASVANSSGDFSQDLWRTVWEVSNLVLDDMGKERRKQKMKRFLQSEEVKEMCRFAGEIGIRGDMLRELRFKWAREKMEESEFYASLEKLKEQEESSDKEEVEETSTETLGEMTVTNEEEKVTSLLRRHGKMKYKIYGLDLSDPKWAEVADKIHDTGEIIWPQEAKPIHGKTKLVTEKILSLKEDDDHCQLLAEWEELLQPRRIDWITLLDKLKEWNRQIFYKVAEHLLSEKSFQPSRSDYSLLIHSYAKEDRAEDAERIVKKMNEDGIFPDMLTSTILVHMYCKAGNLQRAKEAFENLRSFGFQPDMKTYTSMILAYANAGEPKLGEALLREMEARDVKPTEEIYMALLRSFSHGGDVKGADRIVTTMQFAGFQPSLESCSYLVEAHGCHGDHDKARINFDYISKIGLKPDDKTTACMITAYERNNLLDKALELLLQLEKEGFEPGPATYTVLVRWFGKLGLVEEAEEVLGKIAEQGEAPPFEIHVSFCDMYARAGNEKKALQALAVIESKKEQLTFHDFERVINGLQAGGFLQDAKRMFELMKAQGFTSSKQKENLEVSLWASKAFDKRQNPLQT